VFIVSNADANFVRRFQMLAESRVIRFNIVTG